MKRFVLSLLVLCVTMGFTFAQGFEGTISVTNSLRPSVKTDFTINGTQAVQRPTGPGLADMKVFTDLADNACFLWVQFQGNIQVTRYALVGSSRRGSTTPVAFSNVTATGNQKKVSGYDCEEYSGMADGRTFTAWVAPELKDVNLKAHISSQSFEQLSYSSLPDVEGMVLEFSSTYGPTNQAIIVKTEVNPHPVDVAVVTAPEPTSTVD